jgi:hypothetical protein
MIGVLARRCMAFTLFRWLLELSIESKALSRVRGHEPLAWLFVPLTFSTLALGVLEQPTEQGFMVISVAFSLAALRTAPIPIESPPAPSRLWKQRTYRLGAR